MQKHRRSLLQFVLLGPAVMLNFAAAAQGAFHLGREWQVTEYGANGRYWVGVWTRRGNSDTFDAQWRDSLTGSITNDVIEFRGVRQNTVILYRYGIHGNYFGQLSSDGREIVTGSGSWYPPGGYWTARIRFH